METKFRKKRQVEEMKDRGKEEVWGGGGEDRKDGGKDERDSKRGG